MPYVPFHADWKPDPDPSTPVTDSFLERLESYLVSLSTVVEAVSRPRLTFMAIGDSLTAVSGDYDPIAKVDSHMDVTGGGHGPRDWVFAGNLLSGSRLDVLGVAATGGMTSQQIRDVHLPKAVAAAPTWCSVIAGANDLGGDIGAAIAVNDEMCDALEAVGTTPILAVLPPLSTGPGLDRLNEWAADRATRRGYPLIDFASTLTDPVTGGYRAGLSDDNVHPNSEGTVLMAEGFRDVILGLGAPPARAYMVSRPRGDNPLLIASSGTIPYGWWTEAPEDRRSLVSASPLAGNVWTVTRDTDDILVFGPEVSATQGQAWDLTARVGATPGSNGGDWGVGVINANIGGFQALAWGQQTPVPAGTILHWRGVIRGAETGVRPYFVVSGGAGASISVSQVSLRVT